MRNTLDKEYTNGKQGFTLIEIMLVIAVIGVLAVVTVPKYQAVTNQSHLESSAQKVVGQLRYAKQLAMDQRETIYLVMDTNTVRVLDARNKEYGGSQAFDNGVNFDKTSAESNGLTVKSDMMSGLPYVEYDYHGFVIEETHVPGVSIKVVLSGKYNTITIVVEPQTGNIKLE